MGTPKTRQSFPSQAAKDAFVSQKNNILWVKSKAWHSNVFIWACGITEAGKDVAHLKSLNPKMSLSNNNRTLLDFISPANSSTLVD